MKNRGYAHQDPARHFDHRPDAGDGLCPAAGACHEVQLRVDTLHRGLLAADHRAAGAVAHGYGRGDRSALVVRLPGRHGVDLPVDRGDVRAQALQVYRPPESPADAAQQAHPDGRVAYRGEGPVAFLEGAARRAGSAALFGEDVADGPFARRAQRRAARDHRQYDLCDRGGDPLAARDFEQPFAARAQRFRTGAGRAEFHRQECGHARREDPLHDQPPHRTLRYGRGGDPLPGDLRADKQFAQAFGLFVDQPFAFAERAGAGARLFGRRPRVQSAGDDGLRYGAFEHRVAHQFARRHVRHHLVKGRGMRTAIRINTQEEAPGPAERTRRRKKRE